MRTPCLVCGRPVTAGAGGRCALHRRAPRQVRARNAWTVASRQVRQEGVCAVCGAMVGPANLDAHHVIPLSVLPDQDGTAVPLCKPCHRTVHDSLERPATPRHPR